jgi:hypothetical protein
VRNEGKPDISLLRRLVTGALRHHRPSVSPSIQQAVAEALEYRRLLSATDTATADALEASGGTPGPAVKLAFDGQLANGSANEQLFPLIVNVDDAAGQVVTSDTSDVTLTIADGPTGGVLAGTLTVAAVNGVATFSNVTLSASGTYTLTASDGKLSSATSDISILPGGGGGKGGPVGPALKLVFQVQPLTGTAGERDQVPVVVDVEDAAGHIVPSDSSSVTLAVSEGPNGAVLGGTVTATAINGVATFPDLTYSPSGTYALTATDGKLVAATSQEFAIRPVDGAGKGSLTPTLVRSIIPSPLFVDLFVNAAGVVKITNNSSALVHGSTTIELDASYDGAVDSFSTLLGSVTPNITLAAGRSTIVVVPVSLVNPVNPPSEGDYQILVKVTDPSFNTATTSDGPTVTVAYPAVVFVSTFVSTTLGASGAIISGEPTRAVAIVQITNIGNFTAHGPASIDLYASPDQGEPDGTLIRSYSRPILLRPGASTGVVLPLLYIPGMSDGSYFLNASVGDASRTDPPDLTPGSVAATDTPVLTIANPVGSLSLGIKREIVPRGSVVAGAANAGGVEVLSITNNGNTPVPPGREVDITLIARPSGVDDGSADLTVAQLTTRAVSLLPPRRTRLVPVIFRIPQTSRAGDYSIVATMDTPNLINSKGTTQATGTAAIAVASAPAGLQLFNQNVPAEIQIKQTIDVTDLVVNFGVGTAKDAQVKYYVSTIAGYTSSAKFVGGRDIGALVGGDSSTGTTTLRTDILTIARRRLYMLIVVTDGNGNRAADKSVRVVPFTTFATT